MEERKISWGAQYELARGVLAKNWTWDDVTIDVLERLRGSNAEAAPKVHAVMLESMGKGRTARPTDSRIKNIELW
jgi:hypothetical protein